MKPLLLIPNPGLELRIIAWLKVYQPDVVILTQGKGAAGLSRLNQSIELLNELGLSVRTDWIQPVEDRMVYQSLLSQDPGLLIQWFNQLQPHILKNQITAIVANASEGYHPFYELCRILANQITHYFQQQEHEMLNLEFPVITHPSDPEHEISPKIEIHLTEQQLKEKIDIARSYATRSGIKFKEAVEAGFSQFGEEAFKYECLYPSHATPYEQEQLPVLKPFFETEGKKRQAAGIYKEIICADDIRIITERFKTRLFLLEENLSLLQS